MNLIYSHKKFVAAVVCAAALAGCDSITSTDESPEIARPADTVVIGGTVTGLSATRPVELTMVLTNNGINDGTKEFSVRGTEVLRLGSVAVGANYAVSITGQPTGRTCTIANGSGTATGPVDNIAVTCVRDDTQLFTLTANIAQALADAPPQGFAVTLTTEEGSETIQPTAGQLSVTFTLPIFYPTQTSPPPFSYTVTATNTVGGTTNKCLVNGANGALVLPAPTEEVPNPVGTNIATGITVASCLYTISAAVQYSTPSGGVASPMGAGGLQLALRNQVTNEIDAQAPVISAFPATQLFPGSFASNSQALYEVVVEDHPDGQFCAVQSGGMVNLATANANVTVQVRCRDVPALANQLKGIYQRDTPALRETAEGNNPVGSFIPEPRVQTRDFLAFFPNGTFIHGTHRATATTGVEYGFYNYNPGASTLNFTILTDTNGSSGGGAGTFPAVAACGYTAARPVPDNPNAPNVFGAGTACAPTLLTGPMTPFIACGGTCSLSAPAWVERTPTTSSTGGLSGTTAGTAFRSNFSTAFFNYPGLTAPLTATNVVKTAGAPGVPGTLSLTFGVSAATNLNPVWTLTEPVNTPGQIQGSWATADSKRVFVYNRTTYYGFHAGVNGAPNLQDACFTILDTTVAEGFYTRRGGDTGCMAAADADVGTVATGTVDVPNATTTNSTAPLIPGFIGRLPGSLSNSVSSPSPVLFSVVAGTPDTLTIQNTLNGNPIQAPVVFSRHTTY
jgi:hypothetical protein